MAPLIKTNAVVLFQGDSITDAGRDRNDPANLGTGYAMMAAAWFSAKFPSLNVKWANRGISGDRVKDLRGRWDEDARQLGPTWVSILIGINDTWRAFDENDPTSIDGYYEDLRKILKTTQKKMDANIILMEPFLLPVPEDRKAWRKDLDPRIHAVRELAREFGALLVPLDGIFSEASMHREEKYWAEDGVHPTMAGHALIARSWLRAVRA